MPPMLNNALVFAEAYDKSDTNNNSLINEPARSEVKSIKVKLLFFLLMKKNACFKHFILLF